MAAASDVAGRSCVHKCFVKDAVNSQKWRCSADAESFGAGAGTSARRKHLLWKRIMESGEAEDEDCAEDDDGDDNDEPAAEKKRNRLGTDTLEELIFCYENSMFQK